MVLIARYGINERGERVPLAVSVFHMPAPEPGSPRGE